MFRFLHRKRVEREKIVRLEEAESSLESLKTRGAAAIKKLEERQDKNHWRESIQRMIQGV